MVALKFASVLAISTIITANPVVIQSRADKDGMPETGAAFGDSFSAGIGAGNLLKDSKDQRDFDCARTGGSYPTQLAETLGWGKMSEFYSCSGDILSDIDGQVERYQKQNPYSRVDFATLSISGNDFGFGDVVKACVYPFRLFNWFKDYKAACTDSIKVANEKIHTKATWDSYREKVELLQHNVIKDDGQLFITGYPKFFAEGSVGDACDGESFIETFILGNVLFMTLDTRQAINAAVELVNKRIQELVVNRAQGSVKFFNPNPAFENHRFCEWDKETNPKGSQPDDKDVWFNDIDSKLIEAPDNWKGAHPTRRDLSEREEEANSTYAGDLEGSQALAIGPPSEYQKSSSFHPKAQGNEKIMSAIMNELYVEAAHFCTNSKKRANSCENRIVQGPAKFCGGLSTGGGGDTCTEIPGGCALMKPKDNTSPEVFCKDGTSFFA